MVFDFVDEWEKFGWFVDHIKKFDVRLLKRDWSMFWQRRTRGWDDSETWNLDHTFAAFVTPRLKIFRDRLLSHPIDLDHDEWVKKLDQMIFAFEFLASDKVYQLDSTSEDYSKIQEGLRSFSEHFTHLWD